MRCALTFCYVIYFGGFCFSKGPFDGVVWCGVVWCGLGL